jgi:DNA-directed RNA polymerase subunit RPC12/RpoP
MLILGFQVSRVLMATLVYVCDRCGHNAAHQVVKQVRKFTLFFVPLFPVNTRYLDTCTTCGRTAELPRQRALAAAGQ